jgi:Ca-activated chloride channel homolog
VNVRSSVLLLTLLAAAGVAASATPQNPPPTTPPPASAQAGTQTAAPQEPAPSFRSSVDLVSLTITATDAEGHYVRDLARDEFKVYEDGVQQDVSFFSRTTLPLSVSLLLDTSASMEERMTTAQAAASVFVQQLRPEDQAQLVDFDSRVNVAVPFTKDKAKLEAGIAATTAGGSTALYNAIYIGIKELKKSQVRASSELRRQAIVVLSDGEDTSSLVAFEEVLELAKRSETAVYAIGLRSKEDDQRAKGYSEADFVLRQITAQTGGRVYFPSSANELAGIYRQISEELSSQYSLGYSSRNPKRDGRWRRIVVHTTRPNAFVRTKQGYYGPTS